MRRNLGSVVATVRAAGAAPLCGESSAGGRWRAEGVSRCGFFCVEAALDVGRTLTS